MSWPAACGQRPGLAPAGHAAVDQARIAGERRLGAEAEALHHAGRKPSISASALSSRLEHALRLGGVLQIDRDARAAARDDVARIRVRAGGPVEADHVRAHVGEQHGGERAGPDAGEFDDAQAGEAGRTRAARASSR